MMVERMAAWRKRRSFRFFTSLGILVFLSIIATGCGSGASSPDGHAETGWAIGDMENFTAVIFHTRNGGATWEAQGTPELWPGLSGTDISAVDGRTAWATLGGRTEGGGMILHTRDGGLNWVIQELPEDVPDGMKGIKSVSSSEAWAVGLRGPVFHTTDGGATWVVVPTPGITFEQVNRMDVLGDDIWIADYGSGEMGMVHSPDGGATWRREYLPGVEERHGPMTVSIVNSQVAWASVTLQGDIYRTLDGGNSWNIDAPELLGPNDIDDMCAIHADRAWMVQNTSGGGYVAFVSFDEEEVEEQVWHFPDYVYEGVSAFDADRAWIVGYRGLSVDPDLPSGSIRHTDDGGESWISQQLPRDDVALWKVSFVGARR